MTIVPTSIRPVYLLHLTIDEAVKLIYDGFLWEDYDTNTLVYSYDLDYLETLANRGFNKDPKIKEIEKK